MFRLTQPANTLNADGPAFMGYRFLFPLQQAAVVSSTDNQTLEFEYLLHFVTQKSTCKVTFASRSQYVGTLDPIKLVSNYRYQMTFCFRVQNHDRVFSCLRRLPFVEMSREVHNYSN